MYQALSTTLSSKNTQVRGREGQVSSTHLYHTTSGLHPGPYRSTGVGHLLQGVVRNVLKEMILELNHKRQIGISHPDQVEPEKGIPGNTVCTKV